MFKCKHVIASPDSTRVFTFASTVHVEKKGFCHKCKAFVRTNSESRDPQFVTEVFRRESRERADREAALYSPVLTDALTDWRTITSMVGSWYRRAGANVELQIAGTDRVISIPVASLQEILKKAPRKQKTK